MNDKFVGKIERFVIFAHFLHRTRTRRRVAPHGGLELVELHLTFCVLHFFVTFSCPTSTAVPVRLRVSWTIMADDGER